MQPAICWGMQFLSSRRLLQGIWVSSMVQICQLCEQCVLGVVPRSMMCEDSLRGRHGERRPQLGVEQAQQRADVGGVVRWEEAPAGALHKSGEARAESAGCRRCTPIALQCMAQSERCKNNRSGASTAVIAVKLPLELETRP